MLITLNPPYRLRTEDQVFVFIGWAQVTNPAAPDIRLSLNGVDVPIMITCRPPRLDQFFTGIEALAFVAKVDFAAALRGFASPAEPFLLEARVTTEGVSRTFEYAVTEGWLAQVFGRPVRARAMPPEHLQVRVAGAAAGEFHGTGVAAARRIAEILEAAGHPLSRHRTILDFGCGPGRLAACIHDLHPRARIHACDIDPEAIAWAADALGDVARFHVNGAEPPLPFADESFDLIYAISVFTHLPEDLQHAWLAELRRVLKPGGILLTTMLNVATFDLPDTVKADGAARGFAYWGDAAPTEGLPGFYRLTYHTHDYVRREWGRGFEVLHLGNHDLNGAQDAVVLRRPRPYFGLSLPALAWKRRRPAGVTGGPSWWS
jgi:SAM-dependent methyltransferase